MNLNDAIVFVSDMPRSAALYRDVLGIPLRFEAPQWTEFATGGATLALHASELPNPNPSDLGREAAGHCRPGISIRKR